MEATCPQRVPEDTKNRTERFKGFFGNILADFDIKYFDTAMLETLTGCPATSTGHSLSAQDVKAVFVKKNLPDWEKRMALAHELAHCIFGHLNGGDVNQETAEREAQIFSGCLMALMVFDIYRPTEDAGYTMGGYKNAEASL